VLVSFQAPRPVRILACFLAGGLLTCVVVGTVVVRLLQGTNAVDGSDPPADPAVYIAAGVVAFAIAFFVQRRPPATSKPKKHEGPSAYERALRRGAPLAFAAGVLLNLLPGVFPLVALKDVAQLDYGVAETAAILTLFYIVMFTLIEVPLAGFLAAPERTTRRTQAFNAWLSANKRRVGVIVLQVLGGYLLLRGVLALI